MQTFQDSETGQFWQFDDDVLVTGTDGNRHFNAPHGPALDAPTTLVSVAPPPPVEQSTANPKSVSRWQGREAMRLTPYRDSEEGASLFDATVMLLARPETPEYYRTAWDELQVFEPDSPMLIAIAEELGLTPNDRHVLFLLAATLKA